ncbi:15077_t:CDS:2, partial [Gigaspora rosea]
LTSSNKSSVVWRPLLSNLRCIQVPLTEVPSVLNLYTFDITSPGGRKVRKGGIKKIMLVDEYLKQLYNPTFAYIEYLGCSARNGCCKNKCDWKGQKNTTNVEFSKKTITNRAANITPSILATELINNSKIFSTTLNTPANQAQPTFTRFTPNLESIQNALKYDKKLHYPSISEFEKVNKETTSFQPKDSYGNIVIFTMPYRGKRGTLYLTSTCPVDTSLTLIQGVFTHKEIYNQATAFTLADQNSYTHLLLKVYDLMKQKKWVEAKLLWVENLLLYTKLAKTDQIDLFGGLSER